MMIQKIVDFFQKHSEFSIVGVLLFVLSMLIIPFPPEVLDTLIGFNLTMSIVVLMVVIYMDSPLDLSAFPTILLMLALMRIGITVSTTRLILLNADAGQIVATFGDFVVGGNLVVGVIVFIIVTVINFIVITKGSERVAEVAARFSLDGMPGKQMSIDSDLRAGNIKMEEAASRRKKLELESKLYGAMDGSMKFVKGDSIASMIDIVVNLLGGLIVGVLQRGLSFPHALSTYSLLTIGDGLVQQIPSLVVSITAGMMITRVSDSGDVNKQNMGQNLLNQIFAYPKALFSTSFILLMFSFVPGMPVGVFCALIVFLSTIGFLTMTKASRMSVAAAQGMGGASPPTTPQVLQESAKDPDASLPIADRWKLHPLILHISASFRGTPYVNKIRDALGSVQKTILVDLGVEIPQIYIRFDHNLADDIYQILVYEVPTATGRIIRDKILFLDSEENLITAQIEKHEKNTTLFGDKYAGFWVDQSYAPRLDEYGLPYLDLEGFLNRHLSFAIKQHVSEFLGMQEVKNAFDRMPEYQDLVRELLRMLPLNKITEILQRLVAEDVSIRNFKVILDAMLEWAQKEKDVLVVTEYIRIALGRYIAYKFTGGRKVIPCILISHDLEDTIRDAIRTTSTGSYLALDPHVTPKIIQKFNDLLKKLGHLKSKPIVIVPLDIRRYVRSIIEKDLPYLYVLSFQELEGHVSFDNVGIIDI